jgi:hypothetical protein
MVFDRLEELSRLCGARHGSVGVWIEDKKLNSRLSQAMASNQIELAVEVPLLVM